MDLLSLNENDNVIRPCILWNDGRTQEECDYLNQQIGKRLYLLIRQISHLRDLLLLKYYG